MMMMMMTVMMMRMMMVVVMKYFENDDRDTMDYDLQTLFPIFRLFLIDLLDRPTDGQTQ